MDEKTQTIQTKVHKSLLDNLNEICRLRKVTKSEYLRQALSMSLDNEPEMYKLVLKEIKQQAKRGKK